MTLSENALKILESLPVDGSKVGNISLRSTLEMDHQDYFKARSELEKAGLIVIGQGKGGSIGRAKRIDLSQEQEYFSNSHFFMLGSSQKTQMIDKQSDADDLELEDENDDDAIEEFNVIDRHIFSDKSDPSVSDLYVRYKEGELLLQPDFQRQFVWDFKKCSKLIESAILEVPLPMIYLAEENDGREAVIDGQQRLTSFFKYMDNEFPLNNLKVIKEINGSYFSDLDRNYQAKIKRCSIRTTTIKKESSETLKFEIFERLNTGSVSLNDQEIRNCIFRGPYNDLLKELSGNTDFRHIIGISQIERRMKDVELVLRFAAFFHASYLNYQHPMRKFLNDDMRRYQFISDQESKELQNAFKNSVHIIRSLFDKRAFRRFYRGVTGKPNGYWETKKFSASLYDVLMYSFAKVDKHKVYQCLDAIREAFIWCMTEDDDFIETIERGTSNKSMVIRRFDKWRIILENILVDSSKEQRCFSFSLKEELFNSNPTCAICGQRIHGIDDAAVDHIKQYWQGGLTIPENAQLTHRYCNWSRSRKD